VEEIEKKTLRKRIFYLARFLFLGRKKAPFERREMRLKDVFGCRNASIVRKKG